MNLEKNIEVYQESRFWHYLFYFSWSIIAIWLILKVSGVIHTPLWLEYGIPIGGFLIGIVGIYQNIINKIHNLGINLATLTVKFDHIEIKVNHLEKDMEIVKKNIS